VAERAHLAQLFFSVLQVLLHLFELRKSFLDVLIQFLLHLIGDGHQLGIDAIANRFQALRRLLIQVLKFNLELLRGAQERACHLAAAVAQRTVLLFPARRQLLLDRAPNL